MREYCLEKGGAYRVLTEQGVEDWLAGRDAALDAVTASAGTAQDPAYSLLAFPAQDNFAGVKYPLSWVERAQARSTSTHRWLVALDAAAFLPTNPLDLSQIHPDFVALSFYKIFGWPTGLGALVMRTEAADVLQKLYWGGGTVSLATAGGSDFHVPKCRPSERFEDGTVAFLDIMAISHGFDALDRVGGPAVVSRHVAALAHYAYERMSDIRHSNGAPAVLVFGKHAAADWHTVQGGVLNFEVLDDRGSPRSYKEFEEAAVAAGLHLRTGSLCNPGACYACTGVEDAEVQKLEGEKEGCDDAVEWIMVRRPAQDANPFSPANAFASLAAAVKVEVAPGPRMEWVRRPLGTVRASFGAYSTLDDVQALVDFVRRFTLG